MKFPITFFAIMFFVCSSIFAQEILEVNENIKSDTLTKKEKKSLKKEKRLMVLKEHGGRFKIKGTSIFANLNTTLSFEIPPNGILTANIGLEQNLGLPSNNTFFAGTTLYLFTPRSGIFAQYYGIQRSSLFTTTDEYTFLDITIPAGTEINTHFNTNVFSVGYLLTILRDNRVFLGTYLSFYFMDLSTGVYEETGQLDEEINFLAPLPNFGLIASFELTKWLYFDANIGFFSISLEDLQFSGGLYNLSIGFVFKPTKWLGINASYELFDVNVKFKTEKIPTSISYRFQGPALGISVHL